MRQRDSLRERLTVRERETDGKKETGIDRITLEDIKRGKITEGKSLTNKREKDCLRDPG